MSRDPWNTFVAIAIAGLALALILGAIAEEERSLRLRYRALVDDVDVVVWEMIPGTGQFSYVSPRAEALLGYPLAHWYRRGFWEDHLHPVDAARVCAEVDEAVAAGVDHTLEYRMVAAGGQAVYLRDAGSIEHDAAGRSVNIRGVMMDVSDRRRAEDELREQATHDSLTGLANRWLLVERLEAALAEPQGRRRGVALLLLDLDDFKEVNDTLGHEAGDSLLVALGDRLRDELADCDTVARLGGDEFAVLLTADADEGVAVAAATRPGHPRASVRGRWPPAPLRGQHRHRPAPRSRRRRRHADRSRRHRHVPRQAERSPLGGVRARPRRDERPAPHHARPAPTSHRR